MTQLHAVQVVEFFLTVGVLWFTYSCVYKRVRNDIFRENLFAVRDELFDYMLARKLSFQDPAYGLLRSSLNGMIRGAHEGSFNLGTFWIYLHAVTGPRARAGASRAARIVDDIQDQAQQAYFRDVFERVSKLAVYHLWLEGPVSLVLGPLLLMRIAPWTERNDDVVDVGVEMLRHETDCLSALVA